jgi:peptidoglycan/xylan/chitin deacetylase (PgdA/CDA1 family)
MDLPILMYHKIGYPKPGQRYRNLSVNPQKFAGQVRWLKHRGYRTVTFADLSAPAVRLPPKPVMLTFDDGYENYYTDAFPILEAAGFTACVYVVVSLVGKTNEWSRGRTDVEERLMTWAQIEELQRRGMEFGSHTMTHRELQGDAVPHLPEEIGHSKRALEDRLGRPVLSFAWPGGVGADSTAQRAFIARCGYRFACRADGGREIWPPRDPLALRRDAVGEKHSWHAFAWKLGALW